jgi:acetyltransferase-like isoleucine patch superfamily enzyme
MAGQRVFIRGLENIDIQGKALLTVGLAYTGFTGPFDPTWLNIQGKLVFADNFSIAKGCRFDIGQGAVVRFGAGYVNANTTFAVMHELTVGTGCAISWGCEFLDEDFHHLDYPGKKERANRIEIGDSVWIGANSTILRGSVIPDGCVVAAGSRVSSAFSIKNALIAGNPARVVKENVRWK